MSPEARIKLKAYVLLTMLSVSEGRRVSSRIFLNGSQSDGSSFQADGGAARGVSTGSEHERFAANPNVAYETELAFEQPKAIGEDPGLQEHFKRFAEQIYAMLTVSKVQEQAEHALEQLKLMMEDPGLRENVKRFSDQLHALATHPMVLLHVKHFAEHRTNIMEDQTFSQHAKLASDLVAEQLEAIMEDQDVREYAALASEHLKAIMQDPLFQEQSRLLAERMQPVMTDSKVQQHIKLASEQLKAVIEDPRVKKNSEAVAELMEAIMTDLKIDDELLMGAINSEQTESTKGEASSLVEEGKKFIPPLNKLRTRISHPQSVLGGLGEPYLLRPSQRIAGELQKGGSKGPEHTLHSKEPVKASEALGEVPVQRHPVVPSDTPVQPLTPGKGIRSMTPLLVNAFPYLTIAASPRTRPVRAAEGDEYSPRVKATVETQAPFRQARLFFLFPAAIAGAAVGAYVSLTRVAAGLSGMRSDLDPSKDGLNFLIDAAVVATAVFFGLRDSKAKEEDLKKVATQLGERRADKGLKDVPAPTAAPNKVVPSSTEEQVRLPYNSDADTRTKTKTKRRRMKDEGEGKGRKAKEEGLREGTVPTARPKKAAPASADTDARRKTNTKRRRRKTKSGGLGEGRKGKVEGLRKGTGRTAAPNKAATPSADTDA